jgi:hypothetical protein
VLAVAAAIVALLVSLGGGAALSAAAGQQAPAKSKRYKATRAIAVDKQSGQARMPTQEEVEAVVADLWALAQRPDGDGQESTSANGAVSVELAGGFGGVLLARPGEGGTWETRCVFTFEEGAEFLGLVEDDSAR